MCRHDYFTDHCPRLQWPVFLRLSNSPDSSRWLISWALQAQSRHRGRSYTRSDTGVVCGPYRPNRGRSGATAGAIPWNRDSCYYGGVTTGVGAAPVPRLGPQGPQTSPPTRAQASSNSQYNTALTTGVGAAPVPRLGPQGPQTSHPDPSSMHRPHSQKGRRPLGRPPLPHACFQVALRTSPPDPPAPYPRSHRYAAGSSGPTWPPGTPRPPRSSCRSRNRP